MDVKSGKVIYARNAKELRYPASLAKMMTLYLLFDALKHGQLTMDKELPVSAKAAAQPSTNLSLSAGDSLPVRKALEGLVVRSANDAAMVVAETLGKTEWNFALMMNRKARELGMRDTVFRNPNGLPDPAQQTTAMDLAKLGIALRRDFPEYYQFFALRSFDYAGRTYTTHNRVMLRYPGVDGLKTGFINASGFNVVTSAKKDGYNLVAVVMGGRTATARDNTMISLLDNSFYRLAQNKVGDGVDVASAEPESAAPSSPEPGAGTNVTVAKAQTQPKQEAAPKVAATTAAMASLEPAAGAEQEGEGDQGVTPTATVAAVEKPAKKNVAQLASVWGVQVGVFSSRPAATKAARAARTQAGLPPKSATAVAAVKAKAGRILYRARVMGLSEAQAREACKSLGNCLAFKSAGT